MASLKHWIWLTTRPSLNRQSSLALLRAMETPERIYHSCEEDYLTIPGITREQINALEDKSLEEANAILGECRRLGLQLLTIQDTLYPDRLRNIYDPPLLLYIQGRMPAFDDEFAVAMVGTRDCTPYGEMMAERLGFELASQGAVVVSGLARGIDACAHRGALRGGGTVVGVIAGGHDKPYPIQNRYLYADVAAVGAVISEYPPGTLHLARHFPVRNRIISGLCQATLVVEAPARSGALITANAALEQGRDVFAVPGPAGAINSVGCHRLIQEGAGLVMEARDLLREYVDLYPGKLRFCGLPLPGDLKDAASKKVPETLEKPEELEAKAVKPSVNYRDPSLGLTDDQIQIMECLQGRSLSMDDLIEETKIPARRAFSAVSMLQVDHFLEKEGICYRIAD